MKDRHAVQDSASMTTFIDELMSKMSLKEKIGQLNLLTSNIPIDQGRADEIRKGEVGGLLGGLIDCTFGINGPAPLRAIQEIAVHESRLGIPLLLAFDVIHGHQTVFPIPLGLSCSWDMDHVETTARIAAREASASGINWVFSPMVDIGRDPRWGRIAEGSGEDPHLGSEIARAMIRGLQGEDLSSPDSVMACVKHFAGYGAAEGGRDYNNADMSYTRFLDIYLPPFLAAVEAGTGSAMMSFSALNGVPSHADRERLEQVLSGVLKVSDFNGIPEMIAHGIGDEEGQIDEADPLQTLSERALRAGVQMDMMGHGFATRLEKALAAGRIGLSQIESACRAVLKAKYALGLFDAPFARFDEKKAVHSILAPDYRRTAREVAGDCCVLLKNENALLPLPKSGITVAVIGPLADDQKNVLGPWSFQGDSHTAVSVLDGIRNVAGVKTVYAKGANIVEDRRMVDLLNFAGPKVDLDPRDPEEMIAEAILAANASDVVVAVLGEAAEMSGESASRLDIGIPDTQRSLLKALAKTGKPIVLVTMNGRPLTLPWEKDHIPAILVSWFGGMEAGNAIADILFGERNPSGKLSTTWPSHVGQVPLSYYHANTGRPGNPDKDPGKYTTRCYLDGSSEPLFPFGFGLSYTSFAYGPVEADKTVLTGDDDVLTVSITVTNTGGHDGAEVVQMYLTDPVASVVRPVRMLKGFQKIWLRASETKTVSFRITTRDLEFCDSRLRPVWEAGKFVIGIGTNSNDLNKAEVFWNK
ncbi:beta-glucosidase BglX [Magnetospirillum fulvum]|uniref:beta-glucosidase n=1 Tax=Magnetospirillum fulvum MGU-K5 TaxID=1316936 RepID=S9TGS6_MAGFU|nr:beta-glucosidase BglX [Magnetospirillum fulvum]EPY01496.1 beta-glucosidase-like glycosyl hydrolase [Magnetospirillum fulvum MGU-K5]